MELLNAFEDPARSVLALLGARPLVGMDTPGAVQLATTDDPTLAGPSGSEPIGRAEIAAHIRQLHTDPEAWLIPGYNAGYFSLAGAQSKFALDRTANGQWSADWAHGRAVAIVQGLADAYSAAARDADLQGADMAFAARIVDQAARRTARLRRDLRAVTTNQEASAGAPKRLQPRNDRGRYGQ